MEQEFLQLAQEAVGAMKAAPPAPPVDIAAWAQVGVTAVLGSGQLLLIAWGLWRMGKASEERNRQLDMMDAANRKQNEEMTKAFTQQGDALKRQGEMMTEALQGLRQQGQVLAELLRRTT